jgi:DNA-binding NarL/FixJ family response regulator
VVATANSFRKGIELTIELRPDVVLLELKGGSHKTLRDPIGDMREALAGHPAGIIVLTSYADDVEREAALQAGANRYLLKRIDSLSLLREIEAVAGEESEQTS